MKTHSTGEQQVVLQELGEDYSRSDTKEAPRLILETY